MKIELKRTRKKKWEDGYFYFLPTLRFHWSKISTIQTSIDNVKLVSIYSGKLSLIWLTFNTELSFMFKK